jgi:hypothetical protein
VERAAGVNVFQRVARQIIEGAFDLSVALLLPELWTTFLADFRSGRNTRPVSSWTIERYANRNLMGLRAGLRVIDYAAEGHVAYCADALRPH